MVGPGGGGVAGAKPANQKGFGGTFQAAFAGAFAGGGKFGKQPVEAVNPKNRTSRVVSEISTMSSSLPVFPDSSIFVRSDETRPDVVKALITGPQVRGPNPEPSAVASTRRDVMKILKP
jgi:hypothetical protein